MKKTLTVLLALVLVLALAVPAFATETKDPPAAPGTPSGYEIGYNLIVDLLSDYTGAREAKEVATVLIGNPTGQTLSPYFSGPNVIGPDMINYNAFRKARQYLVGAYQNMIGGLAQTSNQTEAWVWVKSYGELFEATLEGKNDAGKGFGFDGALSIDIDFDTNDCWYNALTGKFEGHITVHVANAHLGIETSAPVYPVGFQSSDYPSTTPPPRPQPTTTPSAPAPTFTDVKPGDYFYDAVQWAISKGITVGTSATTFSPNATCTRAEAVTFLWRAAGSPEPVNVANPFTDVGAGEYYAKAALWAVSKGITVGTSATTFSPNATCTRAEIMTFLYRYAGQPAITANVVSFGDVRPTDYYYNATLWAAQNGISVGIGNGQYGPSNPCTRGQIVTFLYKYNNK